MRSVLLVLLVTLAAALAATPQPPNWPAFRSTIDMVVAIGSSMPAVAPNATMLYDASLPATAFRNAVVDWVGYALRDNIFDIPGRRFVTTNTICRDLPVGGWEDFWAWLTLPTTQFVGTESVNGQQCNIWRGAVPKGSYTNTMMLSANVNTNWPVLWNATVTDAKGRTAAIVSVRFHSDFAPAHPPKRLVLPPDRCFGPGFLCPGAGVQTMPMVRLHDENYYGLQNRNTADMLGEAAYACRTILSGTDIGSRLFSFYEVQVNTSWGRYSKCDNNVCVGATSYSVGREAAYGARIPPGQCLNNDGYGTWYSLNKAANCPDDQPIGTNGCAWKLLSRVKTINATCALDQHLLQACQSAGPPYTNAVLALEKAFDSCPAVNPPTLSSSPSSRTAPVKAEDKATAWKKARALFTSFLDAAQLLARRD